jgi:dodecin
MVVGGWIRHCVAALSYGALSETIGSRRLYGSFTYWTGSRTCEESSVSVYRVTDLIGTSTETWEDAAAAAVTTARKTLRDLRVAEVVAQDIDIDEDGALTYRTKLRVSFKYESEE